MLIPVFTGEKNGKNRPRNARVIVKNKVAPFFPGHGVGTLGLGKGHFLHFLCLL